MSKREFERFSGFGASVNFVGQNTEGRVEDVPRGQRALARTTSWI